MQKPLSITAALLCLFGLSACVNLKPTPSVTESFILGPVELVDQSASLTKGKPIYITRPQLPTYLDDRHLSYRSVSGKVMSIPTARWAEPLPEGIARAMSLYLSASEKITVEGYYPWPNTAPGGNRLSLNFQRFGATDTGEVQVLVRWVLQQPGGESRKGQFVSKAIRWQNGQPDALVAAYNEALQALALELENSFD